LRPHRTRDAVVNFALRNGTQRHCAGAPRVAITQGRGLSRLLGPALWGRVVPVATIAGTRGFVRELRRTVLLLALRVFLVEERIHSAKKVRNLRVLTAQWLDDRGSVAGYNAAGDWTWPLISKVSKARIFTSTLLVCLHDIYQEQPYSTEWPNYAKRNNPGTIPALF
jgi:hypothetical protein